MQKRHLHILNVVLIVAVWAFVIAAYPRLPDQIPQHIGLGGEVTRWTDRTSGMWFLMPILMMTNLVILYGIGFGMTSAGGFNLPQKERLLALPREAQADALKPMRVFMFAMGTWLIVLTGLLQLMLYFTAVEGEAVRGYLQVALIALAIAPVGGVFLISRSVGRRIDALEAAIAHGGAGGNDVAA